MEDNIKNEKEIIFQENVNKEEQPLFKKNVDIKNAFLKINSAIILFSLVLINFTSKLKENVSHSVDDSMMFALFYFVSPLFFISILAQIFISIVRFKKIDVYDKFILIASVIILVVFSYILYF